MSSLSSQPVLEIPEDEWLDSFGPFQSVGNDQYVFDTTTRDKPLWLGHGSSPLCGLFQFEASWTDRETPELNRIRAAMDRLRDRASSRLPGTLKLLEASDETTPAQLLYDYVALSIIDQFETSYNSIVESVRCESETLAHKYSDLILEHDCDAENFAFRFQFKTEIQLNRFRTQLARVGILNPSTGNTRMQIQFTLNLAYQGSALKLFWNRLDLALSGNQDHLPTSVTEINKDSQFRESIEFHRALISAKLMRRLPPDYDPIKRLSAALAQIHDNLNVVRLDGDNYQNFRQQILDIQKIVYEPTRQTSAEEFDALFASEKPLAIVVLQGKKIKAMVFAGRLNLFRELSGVSEDPYVNDPTVYYSMDLTVDKKFRGGVGRLMKQALVMLAIDCGVTAIHGRNRDRLAAGMWAINLSLGSYELQRLINDYNDNESFRDCIYYRCPLIWSADWQETEIQYLPYRSVLRRER